MPVSLTINGNTFQYPQLGDQNWATDATNWAQAVTSGMLQKAGGSFTLTAEVDFGSLFGAKLLYLKSQAANISATGAIRLGRSEFIGWRNEANSDDLELGVDSSNRLTWNGNPIVSSSALTANRVVVSDAAGALVASGITNSTNSLSGIVNLTGTGVITWADGSASAPAFSFSSESNTGWFRPTSNSAAAAIAGSERLRLDSLGARINLTGPAALTNEGLSVRLLNANVAQSQAAIVGQLQQHNDGAFTGSPAAAINAILSRSITASQTDTSATLPSALRADVSFNVASGQTLTMGGIYANILVGAPTLSGGGSLAVDRYAGISFSANTISSGTRKTFIRFGAISGASNNAFIADNDAFTGNWFLNSTSTNASLFSGIVQFASGSSAAPSLVFSADTTTGFFRQAASSIGASLNGVERLRLSTDGSSNSILTLIPAAAQVGQVILGSSDQYLSLSGGTGDGTLAGIVRCYGPSHASLASRIVFRTNGADRVSILSTGQMQSVAPNAWPSANVATATTITALASTSPVVYLTGTTATALQGIDATNAAAGQFLWIVNLTGANVTIAHENAGATATNRITTLTGADIATTGNGAALFWRDTTTSRWITLQVTP